MFRKIVTASMASMMALSAPAFTSAAVAQDEFIEETSPGAGTWIVAVGAIAAIGLGIWAAVDSGSSDDAPVSP